MIDADEIMRLAKLNRLRPHQQEKHYAQTAVLSGIYLEVSRELVFKGGTALFFFYGLDRFSEDLDFTKTGEFNPKKIRDAISGTFEILGIPHEIRDVESVSGTRMKIKAKGPLYKGPLSESVVDVDISERNDLVLEPEIHEVVPVYADLRPFTVPVMKMDEILAEKIRAITIRGRARDLYDMAFLLKKGAKPDVSLANKKLSFYKKEFEFGEFRKHAEAIEKAWKSELHDLVPKIPEFKGTLENTLSALR
ncbi:MAG: nucleotidyl transferase AbiEii/AbiGii toxin family protein [Candidatus Thermoplasmatota archaeon]|nr:nucleotidyl transferase AbiEii/AbiGii toxin family protein [Candidatus Thermoplasmatota archaeon]